MNNKNNVNIINVKKIMHENSKLRITQEAVNEISIRVIDKLFDLAPLFDENALRHRRKTVFEKDIIEVLNDRENNVF